MPETSPAGRFLPHPDDDWYDPDIGTTGGGLEYVFTATPQQRRSYVRYILAGHGGKRSWEIGELADWEPESLAPWADAVTIFDDAALEQLCDVAWPDYWRASRGASDTAVDALGDRIAATPPDGSAAGAWASDPPYARVHLLAGVDSAPSLTRLADLARSNSVIAEICAAHGLWVRPEGPAIRRYTRQPRLIVTGAADPEPGLRVLPPTGDILADPRGEGCAMPLSIVLDVDLALLDGTPFADATETRRHPFTGSRCSDCDADEQMADNRTWSTVDGKLILDEERDERCPGYESENPWENPSRLGLGRSDRYVPIRPRRRRVEAVGTLGGLPDWQQSPSWPVCCDRPMVYVGQTSQGAIGGFDQYLYGFACECGNGSQIGQHT